MIWLLAVGISAMMTAFNMLATIAAFSIYAHFTGHFSFEPLTVAVWHVLISGAIWATLATIWERRWP